MADACGPQLNSDQSMLDIHRLRDLYIEQGFIIIASKNNQLYFKDLREKFESLVLDKFTGSLELNRELIKRFTDFPEVKRFYYSEQIEEYLKMLNIIKPVACGPIVSHYTSNDDTGSGFFSGVHQDYPSMASSFNSCIVWCSLSDSNQNDEHGILVYPKMHKQGVLKGLNTTNLYKLDNLHVKPLKLDLKSGDILIMNSFLPHGTHFSPHSKKWKLSLSQRYDDLDCKEWKKRMYKNAYKISVDRELYLKQY